MNKSLEFLKPQGTTAGLPTHPVRVLGIDLGTTNSTVAEITWRPGQTDSNVRCLDVEQETLSGVYTHCLVPSVVALHDGRVIVGEGAKRLLARSAELGFEREKSLFLECKNDMGVQRTYHKAPTGFRSAAEIGGQVLSFLKSAAAAPEAPPAGRTVVTVPASFQAAQRVDTVKAAWLAGIKISGGDLLDEPVAAFLDYLMTHPGNIAEHLTTPKTLVVFDFGGGTCDVAVLQLSRQGSETMQIAPLAVSRYHRLGGGDIDRAIVYDVLLPQLLEQNKLRTIDLTYEEKKNCVEAAFLGVAEALKTGLCTEISRLEGFGQYATADKDAVVKKQPGVHVCRLSDRVVQLQAPSLSAAQFEKVLAPFLDKDLLFARETEYRLTCSIFAPIQDALDRCQLEPKDVDLCLLVGGSSLIPQVAGAVARFFPKARQLTYEDRESVQLAVARGAAWHALSLALYGRGLFQAATSDRIAIATKSGSHELIPKASPLPFPPGGGWARTLELAVPDSSFPKPVDLLVEILAGETGRERRLFTANWEIPAPVAKGDKLSLEYRIDENQVLEFRLTLVEAPDGEPFAGRIENPLTNVVNPHAKRLKIQQAEEALRTGKVPTAAVPGKIVEIARDYAEVKQSEKAIAYLQRVLLIKNEPDPFVLNLMGIYYGELGNPEKEEKCYRECARTSQWSDPLFNLALAQKNRRRFGEAMETVEASLTRRVDGPTLTLKALIAEGMGRAPDRDAALKSALSYFSGSRAMSDWELGWFATAARMAGQTTKLEEATAEQRRRKAGIGEAAVSSGQLPVVAAIEVLP